MPNRKKKNQNRPCIKSSSWPTSVSISSGFSLLTTFCFHFCHPAVDSGMYNDPLPAGIHLYRAAVRIKIHLLKMASVRMVQLCYCTPNMDCVRAIQNLQCWSAALLIYPWSLPSQWWFILTHIKRFLIHVSRMCTLFTSETFHFWKKTSAFLMHWYAGLYWYADKSFHYLKNL